MNFEIVSLLALFIGIAAATMPSYSDWKKRWVHSAVRKAVPASDLQNSLLYLAVVHYTSAAMCAVGCHFGGVQHYISLLIIAGFAAWGVAIQMVVVYESDAFFYAVTTILLAVDCYAFIVGMMISRAFTIGTAPLLLHAGILVGYVGVLVYSRYNPQHQQIGVCVPAVNSDA